MLLYEEFFRELQFVRCYSENTLLAYKKDMAYYKDFCQSKRPIQEFYFFLTEKKLSPRTQSRVVSCVRTYLKFLQSRNYSSEGIQYLKFSKLKNKLPNP